MTQLAHADWQHHHDFHITTTESERRTRLVVYLTGIMMVGEIIAGYWFGSMALLADGWHMGTHVTALAIAVFAYRYARQQAGNPQYSFGTGKVGSLGGFASALLLVVVALFMGVESVQRFISPEQIQFNEAILVACIGLAVNLASAWLLGADHDHDHGHGHGHLFDHHDHDHDDHQGHDHHQASYGHNLHDQNLRAAYIHVVADAATSVLAIVALIAGKFWGWVWMDACMGIVGAGLIANWSLGLLRDTSAVLLDRSPDEQTVGRIRQAIEAQSGDEVADLHVWRLGPKDFGAIISVVTHEPRDVDYYKHQLQGIPGLGHVTVEVNQCRQPHCV